VIAICERFRGWLLQRKSAELHLKKQPPGSGASISFRNSFLSGANARVVLFGSWFCRLVKSEFAKLCLLLLVFKSKA
jgi:hypothetical protein